MAENNPSKFGVAAFTKEGLYEIVEILVKLSKEPLGLTNIKKYSEFCARWGAILSESLEKPRSLFVRGSDQQIQFEKIAMELQEGRAVLINMKLHNQSNHVFTLEPQINGEVSVIHAWEDMHTLRMEIPMPIEELITLLENLQLPLAVENARILADTRGKLWGADHADPGEITEHMIRRKISFEHIISGKPSRPLQDNEILNCLGRELVGFSEEVTHRSFVKPVTKVAILKAAAARGAICAGLGFVFGAAGVLIMDKIEDKWKNAAIDGKKEALGGGARRAAGGIATKILTPTISRLGVSVFRANAIAGAAMFSVFAIWDISAWAANNITAVELRKRTAQNLGGTAGGVVGGIAGGASTGAVAGLVFGPVGVIVSSIVGGIVGGIGGGIGGAMGGLALDKLIWCEDEDTIMNSYEFFGWRFVERDTRPVMSAQEIVDAYMKKQAERPEKVESKDWVTICTATMILLLRAMYPEFVELQKIAKDLQEKSTEGTGVISSTMLDLLLSD